MRQIRIMKSWSGNTQGVSANKVYDVWDCSYKQGWSSPQFLIVNDNNMFVVVSADVALPVMEIAPEEPEEADICQQAIKLGLKLDEEQVAEIAYTSLEEQSHNELAQQLWEDDDIKDSLMREARVLLAEIYIDDHTHNEEVNEINEFLDKNASDLDRRKMVIKKLMKKFGFDHDDAKRHYINWLAIKLHN